MKGVNTYVYRREAGALLRERSARIYLAQRQVRKDTVDVTIEEQHKHYHPEREWYEIVLLRGETTRRERIRSGLGKVTIHL